MLKLDDTIATIFHSLDDKEVYLHRVLEKMHACAENMGKPTVKIGVTKHSQGKNPCYWIEYKKDGLIETYGTFQNTKGFKNNFQIDLWSTKGMTLPEVEALLASL
jgi:hypothetical protein